MHKIANKPKRFQRVTQFKIYLTNPSLRSALFSPLSPSDEFIGNMVETAIFSQQLDSPNSRFEKFYYARWQGGEVDMVTIDERTLKPQFALEIKWSNRFFDEPKKMRSLINFMQDNNLKKAKVTTIDKAGTISVGNIEFEFVPSALHALSLGYINFMSREPN